MGVGRKGGLFLLFKLAGNYFLRLDLKHQIYSKIIHKSHLQIVCSFSFSISYLCMPVMGVLFLEGVCRVLLFILLKNKCEDRCFASCIVHNHLCFSFYLNFLNTAFNSVGSLINSHVSTMANPFSLFLYGLQKMTYFLLAFSFSYLCLFCGS